LLIVIAKISIPISPPHGRGRSKHDTRQRGRLSRGRDSHPIRQKKKGNGDDRCINPSDTASPLPF
jgi:hypothetical protein